MAGQTNAERQKGYRGRLKQAAYETDIIRQQIAELETAVNEARVKVGLPEIQLRKSAYADEQG